MRDKSECEKTFGSAKFHFHGLQNPSRTHADLANKDAIVKEVTAGLLPCEELGSKGVAEGFDQANERFSCHRISQP
ncbi:hypothetical protein SNOG_12513 [Parastagonospora nodorum SN15]|uniref:Uncharacterized protein n=1 Tax=Phaeosphaeria nodorum (strain SN15 / ATCC MYA-4574 / FGSC 10173) TaxID=321614 RepID=Q0U6V1_PHANO|nr:hypothetical protein SNOG_12513 [Parastagonospora nodorum SN15]EAT80326.1 hypothetical protein SNOG_12513 [Parastagonospora nodorum SN15]